MSDLFKLIIGFLASLFRSRAKLQAENLVLRQQINVLRRRLATLVLLSPPPYGFRVPQQNARFTLILSQL